MTSIAGRCELNFPVQLNHIRIDEHPIVAIYAGAKRRIAALEQQLQNLQEAGTRQKSYVLTKFEQF
jgi:hypothetical protein